jgi:hypothetical protein
MHAPLAAQQIAPYVSKRRDVGRQEVAAAVAGISVRSALRIDLAFFILNHATLAAGGDLILGLGLGAVAGAAAVPL